MYGLYKKSTSRSYKELRYIYKKHQMHLTFDDFISMSSIEEMVHLGKPEGEKLGDFPNLEDGKAALNGFSAEAETVYRKGKCIYANHLELIDYDALTRFWVSDKIDTLLTKAMAEEESVQLEREWRGREQLYELKKKIVRSGGSQVFNEWQKYASISESDFLEALEWVCGDAFDLENRRTRYIGLEPNRIVKLKAIYGDFVSIIIEESIGQPFGPERWNGAEFEDIFGRKFRLNFKLSAQDEV